MSNIKCNKCGMCCKSKMGPFAFPWDVSKIALHLKIEPSEFIEKYCIKNTYNVDEISVIIYSIKSNENGCVFLDNNLCVIYQFRPYQCIHAPFEFLGQYDFWRHMPCITADDFNNIDTSKNDKEVFRQLIEQNGYDQQKEDD